MVQKLVRRLCPACVREEEVAPALAETLAERGLCAKGGQVRLPRAVGKSKAMDWCLTGRMIDADEAERSGLVARVVPADSLEAEALAMAAKIASYSLPVVLKIKESINRAYESSLNEGLLFERREFHGTFGLDDQKEGMRAFVEKRKPAFKHR